MDEELREVSVRKIGEDSKEYEEHRENQDQEFDITEFAFGSRELNSVRIRRRLKGSQIFGNSESAIDKTLQESRLGLAKKAEDRRIAPYIHVFLTEDGASSTSHLSNEMSRELQQMSNSDYEKLLEKHQEIFKLGLLRLAMVLPEFEDNFEDRVKKAIDKGSLPISENLLSNRLDNTRVILGDGLNYEMVSDRGGQFDPYTESAMIAEQELDRSGERVYTHEMIHALSGRTLFSKRVRVFGKNGYEMPEEIANDLDRVGLRFDSSGKVRFHWLNEAETESITLELLQGDVRYESYKKERELFKLLQTSGKVEVPESLFRAAYFENYDPSLPEEERIPAWKKLYSTLNKAYSPGFLVRLDDLVQSKGVEEAIRQIKEDPFRI